MKHTHGIDLFLTPSVKRAMFAVTESAERISTTAALYYAQSACTHEYVRGVTKGDPLIGSLPRIRRFPFLSLYSPLLICISFPLHDVTRQLLCMRALLVRREVLFLLQPMPEKEE